MLKYLLHLTIIVTIANISRVLNEGLSAILQQCRKIFTLIYLYLKKSLLLYLLLNVPVLLKLMPGDYLALWFL